MSQYSIWTGPWVPWQYRDNDCGPILISRLIITHLIITLLIDKLYQNPWQTKLVTFLYIGDRKLAFGLASFYDASIRAYAFQLSGSWWSRGAATAIGLIWNPSAPEELVVGFLVGPTRYARFLFWREISKNFSSWLQAVFDIGPMFFFSSSVMTIPKSFRKYSSPYSSIVACLCLSWCRSVGRFVWTVNVKTQGDARSLPCLARD